MLCGVVAPFYQHHQHVGGVDRKMPQLPTMQTISLRSTLPSQQAQSLRLISAFPILIDILCCSRYKKALWETDPDSCDVIKKRPPFDKGRVLIDLIELHIYDFIQGMLLLLASHIHIYDFIQGMWSCTYI